MVAVAVDLQGAALHFSGANQAWKAQAAMAVTEGGQVAWLPYFIPIQVTRRMQRREMGRTVGHLIMQTFQLTTVWRPKKSIEIHRRLCFSLTKFLTREASKRKRPIRRLA